MNRIVPKGLTVIALIALFSCTSTGAEQTTETNGISLDEAIEQSAVEVAEELPNGTRIAIVAFTSEHLNLSNYIMDELTGALVDGSLEVADRRNLEYVYKELNFQMSGNVSDESAVSIGKFLGARYVITGQFVKAGGRYRYRLSGINIETAIQESSTRLNVRDDRDIQSLLADVRQSPTVTVAANYGERQTTVTRTAGSYLDSGIYFASQGEYDKAIVEFTEAIKLDRNFAAAYILRGRALDASVSQVYSVGENFSEITALQKNSVSAAQIAVYDRAISDYTQAIRLDPDNARAYRGRGNIYMNKLNFDNAIADFTQAIRIDPNDVFAYSTRGNAYMGKGDHDRAIADHNQAIRLDPNDAISYFNRGTAYFAKRDYTRARADWTKALQLDPTLTPARDNLERLRRMGY